MGTNPSKFQGIPTRPVEQVSWFDASEFCRRLSVLPQEKVVNAVYRLPTEAEWEFACRAGTTTDYGFGDDAADLRRNGWGEGNSTEQTKAVAQLQPNAWGAYDMHGNVWEWCQDWLGVDYYEQFRSTTAIDPQGPLSGEHRVLRGGSLVGDISSLRSAKRHWRAADWRTYALGFRVVCSLKDH